MFQSVFEPRPGRTSLHITSIVEAEGAVDEVLAAQVAALRRSARFTVHQLAERSDVDADVVVRLEAGEVGGISAPDAARRVVKALAEVCRCSPAPLLSRIETRLGAFDLPAAARRAPTRRLVARRDRFAASLIALVLVAASGAWLAQAIGAGRTLTVAATHSELQPRGR